MKTLKDTCKTHYQQQSLSKKQLDTLMDLQKRHKGGKESQDENDKNPVVNGAVFPSVKTRSFFAMAASLFVVIFASWMYGIDGVSKTDIREQVAREIAYNHSKRMALEIASNDLGDVRSHLSELDFTLVDSSRARQSQWQLMGGRYCSIQGKLAAQLRIRKNSGDSYYTYYQAIIPDDFKLDGTSYSTWIEGTYIELWIEGGVLLGLAGEGQE